MGAAHNDRSGSGSSSKFLHHNRNPYAVLNLPQRSDATQPINSDKIRESYRRLSRLLHPDKRPEGKERDDAKALFIEIQRAYETLDDPVLRQAYDHFGHSAVEIIRHNRYAPNSLYSRLSTLHDEGMPFEALEVLHTVLEDRSQKRRRKEWLWNADVEVNMHAWKSPEGEGGIELSSTNVSLSASVPVISSSPIPAQPGSEANQPQQPAAAPDTQKMQLSIGGQGNIKNGMGSTQAMMSANYQPVPHTSITSDIAIGRKIESSISTSTTLTNGTSLSAKATRQLMFQRQNNDKGKGHLVFGFTSNRTLTIFHGRTVHAMFALGVGSNLVMHYGILSLTTWGITSASSGDELEHPPPRLTTKLSIGTQFPIACSIDQSNLFNTPHRSGRASVAWSPLQGFKWKAMLCRKLCRRCNNQSDFAANLGIGVEHTGLVGFTWIIQYQRPEGLNVRIPIFVSSFMSPGYWNRALSISLFSFVIDEFIEESWDYAPPAESQASDVDKSVSVKISATEKERQWLHSSEAKQAAERQLALIVPVAREKRRREELANGLVILKATYSLACSMPSELSPDTSMDATQQLQFWVNKSRLHLPPSSKCLLLGFYKLQGQNNELTTVDSPPRWKCMLNFWLSWLGLRIRQSQCHDDQSKAAVALSVRYKYNGGVYDVTIKDDDALELPSRNALHLGSSKVVS